MIHTLIKVPVTTVILPEIGTFLGGHGNLQQHKLNTSLSIHSQKIITPLLFCSKQAINMNYQ